jgi:anti-sigma factor RsiW
MSLYVFDPCDKCEQMMQPYLDRVLTEEERLEAEEHLDGCDYCRRRYRFETELRSSWTIRLRIVPVAPVTATFIERGARLRRGSRRGADAGGAQREAPRAANPAVVASSVLAPARR